MLFEVVILLLLILLNGVFSMSEIAIVSVRKPRLQLQKKRGSRSAGQALALANAPNRFLSTVQIGITTIGILMGIFSGERVATEAGEFFNSFSWIRPQGETVGLVAVVMVVTFLALVLGELVPKRLGLSYPEEIAKAIALPMRTLSRLAAPAVWLLSRSSEIIVKTLKLKPAAASVTEEEIKEMVQEGVRLGSIEDIEHNLVERVFLLGDSRIDLLMTNRMQVVWLDLAQPLEENWRRILEEQHSVYPVAEGSLDRVKGILYLKDLMAAMLVQEPIELAKLLRPVLYFPGQTKAYKVLERFRMSGIHYALITDEYGGIEGMATQDDILEVLVESEMAVAEAALITRRDDGSWLLDGQVHIAEFLAFFHEPPLAEVEKLDFQTLAGLALHMLGQIPKTGDKFTWRSYAFEIVDMDGNRIDKMLMTLLPVTSPEAPLPVD